MKLHILCKIFPQMRDDELAELAKDIKDNGLRKHIVTLDGEVLDGRNRLMACRIAGVEPTFTDFLQMDGGKYGREDAADFVVSENVNRRHLTDSQRAAVAAEIATARAGNPLNSKGCGTTVPQAAKTMNASEGSVRAAKRIKKQSIKLFNQVKEGKMSIHKAETTLHQKQSVPPERGADAVLTPAGGGDPVVLRNAVVHTQVPDTQCYPPLPAAEAEAIERAAREAATNIKRNFPASKDAAAVASQEAQSHVQCIKSLLVAKHASQPFGPAPS